MSAVLRRLRLVRAAPKPAPKRGAWGPLAAPVDPGESLARSRAQSALTGVEFRDHTTVAPLLPIGQARDVLRWMRPIT